MRKIGRPKQEISKSERISVRVEAGQYERVKNLAAKLNMSISDFVIYVMKDYEAKHGDNSQNVA